MTYARKVDANQAAIVKALRKMGCQVFDMSGVGRGHADLLCNFKGESFFVEVKNGGDRKWYYTPAQRRLRAEWQGAPLHTITSEDEAIRFVENVIGNKRYGL